MASSISTGFTGRTAVSRVPGALEIAAWVCALLGLCLITCTHARALGIWPFELGVPGRSLALALSSFAFAFAFAAFAFAVLAFAIFAFAIFAFAIFAFAIFAFALALALEPCLPSLLALSPRLLHVLLLHLLRLAVRTSVAGEIGLRLQ